MEERYYINQDLQSELVTILESMQISMLILCLREIFNRRSDQLNLGTTELFFSKYGDGSLEQLEGYFLGLSSQRVQIDTLKDFLSLMDKLCLFEDNLVSFAETVVTQVRADKRSDIPMTLVDYLENSIKSFQRTRPTLVDFTKKDNTDWLS